MYCEGRVRALVLRKDGLAAAASVASLFQPCSMTCAVPLLSSEKLRTLHPLPSLVREWLGSPTYAGSRKREQTCVGTPQ